MAATFAAAFAALYAAHQVADHWVQTQHQADTKGHPGWRGRVSCGAHVLTYGLTGLAAIGMAITVLDVHVSGGHLAVGMAVNVISHYIADRRAPLRAMAGLTGHAGFYQLGAPRPGRDDNPSLGTGAYAMDQSWHVAWLFVAALIIAA